MVENLQRQAGNQAVVQLLASGRPGKGAAGRLDVDDENGIPVEAVEWGTESKLLEHRTGGTTRPELMPGARTFTDVKLTRVPDRHSATLSGGASFATGALHLAGKGGGGTLALRKVLVSESVRSPETERLTLTYDDSKVVSGRGPMRASKGTLRTHGMSIGVMSWKLNDEGMTVVLRRGADAGVFEQAMTDHRSFGDLTVTPTRRSAAHAAELPSDSMVTKVALVTEKGVPSFEVTFFNQERKRARQKPAVTVP